MKTSAYADLDDIHVIGIPRALLQYRYGVLWQTFFETLGKTVVISDETDKAIVDAGIARSVDETCLASKIFMGHVVNLIGRCDAVFVPCYASCDMRRGFCTKFQSMTDLVRNTFRAELRVLPLLVENVSDIKATQAAFVELGQRLGASHKESKHAFKEALRAQKEADGQQAQRPGRRLEAHGRVPKHCWQRPRKSRAGAALHPRRRASIYRVRSVHGR